MFISYTAETGPLRVSRFKAHQRPIQTVARQEHSVPLAAEFMATLRRRFHNLRTMSFREPLNMERWMQLAGFYWPAEHLFGRLEITA